MAHHFSNIFILFFCLILVLIKIYQGEVGFSFDHQMKSCVFNRKMNRSVLIIILSVLMIPLIAMFYFYLSIFKSIQYAVGMWAMRAKDPDDTHMVALENLTVNEEINPEEKKQTNKTNLEDLKIILKFTKGLFVMYLMYTFTIFPLCLMMIVDIDQEFPAYFHMYPWMFYRLCSSITPIIYPLFHSSIRFGYKEAIDRYVLCRKKQDSVENKEAPIEMKKKIINSRDYFTNL